MNVIEAIKERCSIRGYQDKDVLLGARRDTLTSWVFPGVSIALLRLWPNESAIRISTKVGFRRQFSRFR